MVLAEEERIRQLTGFGDAKLLYRADLSPISGGCPLRDHLSPDDERRLRAMLREGHGSAELTLSDFPEGNYVYATVVPSFADMYLAVYPFKERKSRDAFPPRVRAAAAATAGAAGENTLLPADAVSAMLAECMLLSEGSDEPQVAYYDLPAVLVRFADAMAAAEKRLDARISADVDTGRFVAVQLSLPHFLKILTSLVSVLAHLSGSRTVRLSYAAASEEALLVRLSTDLPDALSSLGQTEDMLYLAAQFRDAALPLLTAERLAARCGYSLAAHADGEKELFSLTLRLSSDEGEIPDFRSRDQFASFDETFAAAVRFVSGKAPEDVTS